MTDPRSFDDELAGATDRLSLLVRRLRSLSPRAWEGHRDVVNATLNELTALSARLDGRDVPPPALADHVLPDAVAVVGGDVLDVARATRAAEPLANAHEIIERALAMTR